MSQPLVPWKIQRVDKYKMVSLNSWSCKGSRTQNALQRFYFIFEFRIHRTIKRDANLVGLRKIECSSIKIKSKERHSSTSRARRIVFGDFWCRKSQRKSELPTQVRSPNTQSLSLCGDCGRRKSRRESELPTVGSPDPSLFYTIGLYMF